MRVDAYFQTQRDRIKVDRNRLNKGRCELVYYDWDWIALNWQ
jgi:hypothetical protein